MQPLLRYGVPQFWSFAEGEKCLVGADLCAPASDLENLCGLEVGSVESGGWLSERAIATFVAAQHGQWDEDFG